jgi:hypothetical protein
MSGFAESECVIFYGEANAHAAQIYAQLPSTPEPDLQLSGRVTGPRSRLTRTLPATVPLRDLGPGPSILARALVPDPCFWAPGQPYLYDVEVELCRGHHQVSSFRRTLGVRNFGLDRCRLRLQGQPWIMVGCYDDSVAAAPWHAWRELQVARAVVNPSERVCQEASEEGVVLIAELSHLAPAVLANEVQRVAKWAAVMFVIVPPGDTATLSLRGRAPNDVFVEPVGDTYPPVLHDAAHLAICDVAAAAPRSPLAAADTTAWIARRRLPQLVPLAAAVAHCRRWSAELSQFNACVGCVGW